MEQFPFESGKNLTQEVLSLFEADQKDRQDDLLQRNPEMLQEKDKRRYEKALLLFERYTKEPMLFSGEMKYQLAFLFQHGENSEDYEKAKQLALSAESEGVDGAGWLSAAAEDRYLVSLGQPQKWGTQFIQKEGVWEYVTPLEDDAVSGITDSMRAVREVPIRNVQLQTIAKSFTADQNTNHES